MQGEQSLQIAVEGGVLHVTELHSFAVNGFSCRLHSTPWDYLQSPPVQQNPPSVGRRGNGHETSHIFLRRDVVGRHRAEWRVKN